MIFNLENKLLILQLTVQLSTLSFTINVVLVFNCVDIIQVNLLRNMLQLKKGIIIFIS